MSEALLSREILLRCSPAHAFRVFTEEVDLWWPPGHRRSRQSRMRFEAGARGRLVDVAPDGAEWTMARVTLFEPPRRLAMDWYPGSPNAPTRVEIGFDADEPGSTRISITHRALGGAAVAIWPERVARFADGWDAVLAAFRLTTANEETSQ